MDWLAILAPATAGSAASMVIGELGRFAPPLIRKLGMALSKDSPQAERRGWVNPPAAAGTREPYSVQLSENASAQVLNGLPSR